MRVAIVIALLLVVALPAQAVTLYFVGTGTTTSVAAATAGTDVNPPMSPAGTGAKASTYQQVGVKDESAPNSAALPTFIWADPVVISPTGPVVVHLFVEDPMGGLCGGIDGQLFDGAGAVLGPAGGLLVDTLGGSGTVEELVFTFEGIAGSFNGLQFQAGGHWSDCSSLPYTFHWGTDARASRLEYVDGATSTSAPTTAYTNLTSSHLALGFTNATTGLYVYNLTNTLAPVNLMYNVTGNGTVGIVVLDGAGAEALNQTFATADAGMKALAGAAVGNWTYRLQFNNFTGSVTLDLAATQAAGQGSSSGGTGTTTGPATGTGSTTASSTNSTDDKDDAAGAPGPGLTLTALALVVVAAVAQRRRR